MVLIIIALIAAAQAIVIAWLARMSRHVDQVNEAVNHKETGMPTLVQRVIDQDERGVTLAEELARTNAWRDDSLMRVANYLGVSLLKPPAAVRPVEVPIHQD